MTRRDIFKRALAGLAVGGVVELKAAPKIEPTLRWSISWAGYYSRDFWKVSGETRESFEKHKAKAYAMEEKGCITIHCPNGSIRD